MSNSTQDSLLSKIKGLVQLKISAGLDTFPETLFKHNKEIELLDLSDNNLTHLPDEIATFSNLKIIFLTNNCFETFPKILAKLPKLEMISFKSNRLTDIPEDVFPPLLKWLILTDNKINKLPESIGNAVFLQKLMLAGNQLGALPDSFSKLQKLELLRISNNQISEFPLVLSKLASLRWLAFASNPFLNEKSSTTFKKIDWHSLEIGQQLGTGASGQTFQAWFKDNTTHKYAIKIYKNNNTSDGKVEDELSALQKIGKTDFFPIVIAEVINHPLGKKVILFELIPEEYKAIALPPDFSTCTRDIYEPNRTFTAKQASKILDKMKDALAYLHSINISHGDFYGHNILCNYLSDTILTDFGAAADFSSLTETQQNIIKKIELSAFDTFKTEIMSRTIV
jgi:tRNA A-37 threonylcarbamoyl transferase component Bud32